MTSVPPPPGPVDPTTPPPPPPPETSPRPALFAPPSAPPTPQQQDPWAAPAPHPGQHAQPWGAPQQWQHSQPAPGGQYPPPGAYAQQGQYSQQGQYAPQGHYTPPAEQSPHPQQMPWGAPQPAPTGRSKSRAVLLTVIGAVVVVGLAVVAFFAFSSTDIEALPKDVEATTTAHVRELTVGNCLASVPGGSEVAEVTVVPCADTHEAQVVAAKKLSGKNFPGDPRVIKQTTASCPGSAITSNPTPEGLEFLVWTPSADSWEEGDRQGLCVAVSPDAPLTGSLVR